MRPIPYLKGLDILRFFAAALVILAHAHYHLAQLGIAWHDDQIIMHLGGVAVAFFFTLSGFLISDGVQAFGPNQLKSVSDDELIREFPVVGARGTDEQVELLTKEILTRQNTWSQEIKSGLIIKLSNKKHIQRT